MLRMGSLCTGYGGLDMAVQEIFPGELRFVADSSPASAKLLEYRFPDIPNLGDISKVDWKSVAEVDILTAGFPCQPISTAGRKLGTADERWLWPEVERAIRDLRPRLVLLENVSAITVRGLGDVLGGLASCGYVGSYRCVSAAEVGAPHKRRRWFAVSHPDGVRLEGRESFGVPVNFGSHAGDEGGEAGKWGRYASAIRRWEWVTGRDAPDPVLRDRVNSVNPLFSEWMMGLPEGWVTGVPGLSYQEQLHLIGNGVVPQQGAFALESLTGV